MEADLRFQAARIGAAALTTPQCSNGHSRDLILRSGSLAASRRIKGHRRGLMVRDGAGTPPHHEYLRDRCECPAKKEGPLKRALN
jgi:hypothetical protein